MKRIIKLLVVLFAILSIAGCASVSAEKNSGPELHPGHPGHEVH